MKISLSTWFGPKGGRRWWLLVGDIALIVVSYAAAMTAHALVKYYPDLLNHILDDF